MLQLIIVNEKQSLPWLFMPNGSRIYIHGSKENLAWNKFLTNRCYINYSFFKIHLTKLDQTLHEFKRK